MPDRRRRLFGSLIGVVAASATAGWAVNRHYSQPTASPTVAPSPAFEMGLRHLDQLRARFGPKLYSYFDEETLIRDFFQDERDGYFVDVGASHYEKLSNTYYLEKNLGWSGIGIDAQEKYAADYQRYRPHTKFLVYFVGDRESSGKQIDFFVDEGNEFASSAVDGAVTGPSKKIVVPSITLDELLEREKPAKVDFLTMDIEDSEPGALAGFSIERWKPRLVCVEMHAGVRKRIFGYFESHGYVQVVSYGLVDRLNGYFTPAGSPNAQRDAERMRALQAEWDKGSARDGGSAHE
jgi:FkbM family methyltransferase